MKEEMKNGKLSAVMILRLAAPHTWAASVMPVLLGGALAVRKGCELDLLLFACLAAVCVLMQAAVNTFNDYSDFMKGTDTLENSPERSDAVMVYDKPEPKKVLILGFVFILAAAAFGVPAILKEGWRPLVIGAIGAIAVLSYSFGKKPLSYLPIGELVSGAVMGGLIPFAVCSVLSGDFDIRVLVYALPLMLGISLIMMTNNACDIERDRSSGRQTFPAAIGAERTGQIYRVLLCVWVLLPEMLLLGGGGAVLYPLAMLPISASLVSQLRLNLSQHCRGQAMSTIVSLNCLIALAYIAAILFSGGI